MKRKSNLGKGLDALISQYSTEGSNGRIDESLSLSKIKPNKNQPRKDFNDGKMNELISSIKEKGILQPIAVRELSDGKYEIIAGERRYRAAKDIGLKSIPAYILSVKDESEVMEYALIENIQRVDLDPMEEAEAYSTLKTKYKLSQQEISKRVGKSRSQIANFLRLLKLPISVKNDLINKKLSTGHAILILSLKSKTQMIAVANRIKSNNLSVRNTEKLISTINKTLKEKKLKKKTRPSILTKLDNIEDKLIHQYGTKITINSNSKNKGKIIFEFYSIKDLERLLDLLNK